MTQNQFNLSGNWNPRICLPLNVEGLVWRVSRDVGTRDGELCLGCFLARVGLGVEFERACGYVSMPLVAMAVEIY